MAQGHTGDPVQISSHLVDNHQVFCIQVTHITATLHVGPARGLVSVSVVGELNPEGAEPKSSAKKLRQEIKWMSCKQGEQGQTLESCLWRLQRPPHTHTHTACRKPHSPRPQPHALPCSCPDFTPQPLREVGHDARIPRHPPPVTRSPPHPLLVPQGLPQEGCLCEKTVLLQQDGRPACEDLEPGPAWSPFYTRKGGHQKMGLGLH